MRAPLLAILDKLEIDGDDALLQLARVRLESAGLGAELYPEAPGELAHELQFAPRGACHAHLPRYLDLTRQEHREEILEFAWASDGRLSGLTLHDHASWAGRTAQVVEAMGALSRQLEAMNGPRAFLEFSGGLSPAGFAEIFEAARDVELVSACLDVGHVGIRACAEAYRAATGERLSGLRPDSPELPARLGALQEATGQALPEVLSLLARLGRLGKPLHFHLHDGHPLSRLSRFNVCDHLSFLQAVPIPFEHEGRRELGGIFGLEGLRAIVRAAFAALPEEKLSFLLEIHPRPERLALGEHAAIFRHWTDRTNAERMNGWLETMIANAALFRDAAATGDSRP
jgi:hypothetical protein